MDVVRESLGVADLGHRPSITLTENELISEQLDCFRKSIYFRKFSVQARHHWEYCLHNRTEAVTGHPATVFSEQ
ncbi:MAG: hypothetical protein IPM01_03480 [Burkholderiaceae bacterium]|nr:hypothetical protein [Burkholderiaceae bacterium]